MKRLLLLSLLCGLLAACATPTEPQAPGESPSPAASPAPAASPSASPAASPAPATGTQPANDPAEAIRLLASCVANSGTAAATTASTLTDRAGLAQMAQDQGRMDLAQQQYDTVRNTVNNLQTQYGFSCVD
jgi:hypothetical protein